MRTSDQEKMCVLREGANCSQNQAHNRVMRASRRFTKFKKIHAYELKMHKSRAHEPTDCRIHRSCAYGLKMHKSHACEVTDCKKHNSPA